MAPKNGPPDRWMDYSPMGERIAGTRFICMKVPLKPHLSRYIDENERFSCQNAMDMVEAKGHNLGLVIDLSFTTKYYDPRDFEEKNVQYKKIFVPGRVIPKREVLDSFSDVVIKFESENHDNDKLIAVHCTHGLNRTGYMICRHLVDRKKFKPKDAIEAFEEARGYKIEREIYINDLLGTTTDISEQKSRSRSPQKKREHRVDSYRNGFDNGNQFYDDDYRVDSKFYYDDRAMPPNRHRSPYAPYSPNLNDPYYGHQGYYNEQQYPGCSGFGHPDFSNPPNSGNGYQGYPYNEQQYPEYGYNGQYNYYRQPVYQPNPYKRQNPNYERHGQSKPYSKPPSGSKNIYKQGPSNGHDYNRW